MFPVVRRHCSHKQFQRAGRSGAQVQRCWFFGGPEPRNVSFRIAWLRWPERRRDAAVIIISRFVRQAGAWTEVQTEYRILSGAIGNQPRARESNHDGKWQTAND